MSINSKYSTLLQV